MRLARDHGARPGATSASRTRVAQNLFQRRADLADLEVAFGKSTTARIRHIEAAPTSRAAWAAL